LRLGHPLTPTQSVQTGDAVGKRSIFWLIVGLVMLLVIGSIGAFTLHWVDESDFWVDHTREVISTNQRLLLDMRDAESAERGYIITGDERYLEPYRFAAQDIPPTLSRISQLVSDNLPQQRRVHDLGTLIGQRLETLNQGVEQRRTAGFDAAQAVVLAGQGRETTKKIGDTSHAVDEEEYRLLQQRSRTRQVRVRAGFIATICAVLFAVMALVTGPLDVRRALRQKDMAQRQQAESESTARALFQAAAQAILIVDRNGRLIMTNPSTEKMLGYSEAELIGQPIEILVPDAVREKHINYRDGYFSHPQSRPMGLGMDLQARRKDGSTFDAEISLSYIQTAKGTVAVAFVTDISKRKADDLAIRNQKEELRQLAGRLMTAQDDERRRIARDLHDDLSQKLAYLAMDLSKTALKPSFQELKSELLTLRGRAQEAANTVRHISHQLHPSVLDDIGLEAAVEQYCEEFTDRSGITAHFSARAVPESLPREVASSLYHIFQESLRNVSKHSGAKEVFVTMEASDGSLRLTIRDEGVGLVSDRLKSRTSIGIVGMKERANLVNGTLAIESPSGKGTQVSVAVPIPAAG
jgi:PAS domain S-box-containing protein